MHGALHPPFLTFPRKGGGTHKQAGEAKTARRAGAYARRRSRASTLTGAAGAGAGRTATGRRQRARRL